jgi:hypothetical protein
MISFGVVAAEGSLKGTGEWLIRGVDFGVLLLLLLIGVCGVYGCLCLSFFFNSAFFFKSSSYIVVILLIRE